MNARVVEPQHVVDAIRMALEAARDAEAAVTVIRALVDEAPPMEEHETVSVHLLLDAIRRSDARLVVSS